MILNKVGSDRHEALLREALEEAGVPVLGVLRRAPQVATPSRHLGLVPVAERRADAVAAVRGAGRAGPGRVRPGGAAGAGRGTRAGGWPGAALRTRRAPPRTPAAQARGTGADRRRPVVAVAGGAAFTFSYAEHAELLTAAGAEVVTFDPLRGRGAARGDDAGWSIGGGFPEVYAPELSANEPLRKAVAELAPRGRARSPPSARGCCTSRGRWTGSRCAGCSTPTRGCRSG